MFEDLLKSEIQHFIHEHQHDDTSKLLLKHKIIAGVPTPIVVNQIIGRTKAKEKLPTYYNTKNIVFPPAVNIEQCSSETTAQFKIDRLKKWLPTFGTAFDLTGGLGVDTYYLSTLFQSVDYVDPCQELLAIAQHNHHALKAENILYHQNIAEKFIQRVDQSDLIFIDPSRRIKGQKIFRLHDCVPDITTLQEVIFDKSNYLLVKASPLLDLHVGIEELKFVKTIVVLSLQNECKEVLFFCEKDYDGEPYIEAVNILKNGVDEFSFSLYEETKTTARFGPVQRYLYEPNAAILKAGAFKIITDRFAVEKLDANTHLYSSEKLIADFPGRVFQVEGIVKPDKKEWLPYFPEGQANIIRRNYPLTVEQIKKKTGLAEGGVKYLIAFTGQEGKRMVAASRIH